MSRSLFALADHEEAEARTPAAPGPAQEEVPADVALVDSRDVTVPADESLGAERHDREFELFLGEPAGESQQLDERRRAVAERVHSDERILGGNVAIEVEILEGHLTILTILHAATTLDHREARLLEVGINPIELAHELGVDRLLKGNRDAKLPELALAGGSVVGRDDVHQLAERLAAFLRHQPVQCLEQQTPLAHHVHDAGDEAREQARAALDFRQVLLCHVTPRILARPSSRRNVRTPGSPFYSIERFPTDKKV